ncbi:M15 family metallopeptidase [Sphaerisporangium aureirubrum]|uniref:D-alanyl-D-alanine dipeptidase n=1 Tax=Sphaerisporangium aureirubrum TaxID=1544736 RepID=A0ABW1NE09_9ACTN
MSNFILLSDHVILRLPVVESGEPLVDLRVIDALRVDPRLADAAGAYAHLRVGVADRLVAAQTFLPRALRFLVIEGFRPLKLQQQYFDSHVSRLRQSEPGHDPGWYHERASAYIAPHEVAPHVAGAAVDLTLSSTDGTEVWMGTEVNDTDTEACHTASTAISAEAMEHRRTLSRALSAAGMINYPTEWWHWSYGDRYWAYATGAAAARYGPTTL